MAASVREVVFRSLAYDAATKVNTVTTSTAPRVGDTLAVIYNIDYGQLDQGQGPTPGGWVSQVIADNGGAAPYTRCWTTPVTKAGAQTVSITQTDQFTDSNMVLLVIAGADPNNPIDVVSWANGTAATTHPTYPLTTTYPDELVVYGWGSGVNSGDTGTYTLPAGVTAAATTTSPTYSTLAVGSKVQPVPGLIPAQNATFTRSVNPTTPVAYAVIGLAFRNVPPVATGMVGSVLGLTNTVTTSKGVTAAITSTVGVAAAAASRKTVTSTVSSAVGLVSLAGDSVDVRSIPAGGPLDISIWVLDSSGNYSAPLPDYQKITISPVVNSAGSISIDYPRDGLNWDVLHDIILGNTDLEIAVWLGGREQGSLRALILEGAGDEVKEQSVWTFTGAFLEYRLTEAVVYPDPSDPQGQQEARFSNMTAGQIMTGLMVAARARGALSDIGYDSFTATTDSNGIRFSTTATLAVSPGADYLAMLGTLVSVGLCEFEVTAAHQLRLYEPDTRGVDRTTTATTPVILRAARDLTDAPRKYSIRDSATAMIVVGGNGLNTAVSDPAALTRRGRRVERYASQNQIVDAGALTAFGQAALGSRAHGKMELSHGLSFGPGSQLPVADFDLGDWVWSDNGNGLERLRVQQWVITQDQDGILTGAATLGDLIDEHDLQVAARLAAITSGTTVLGTSTPTPTPTNQAKTPSTPTGLVASSLVYTDLGPPPQDAASVFAGWAAVSTNTDGTALSAGGLTYRVRYRYTDTLTGGMPYPEGWEAVPDGLPWIPGGSATGTVLQFSGLSPNRPIQVQVAAAITLDPSTQPYEFDSLNRAFRRTSLQSPWSVGFDVTTAKDTTPPLAPSMPTVTTGPGAIARITWDGNSVDGSLLAQESPDLAYVEVHVSATSNFVPDTTTYKDRFYGPGATVVSDILYQVGYFARLVAVDQGGNQSGPSAQTGFTPHELLSQDLFAGAVGSVQLAYAAVKNANIDVLAVNDAQIGDLSVGKLVSGMGTFDMLLAGRIRTGNAGARIELDNYSLRQYAVDGTTLTTQLISATGEALITGLIRTGVSGKRVEMNPDGTWKLYPGSGLNYNAIFNNGNEVVFRGQLDSSGRSGYLRISAAGIATQFGTPGTSVTAQLSVGSANIDLTSPINGLRSDKRYATANGNPYNNLLIFNDNAGADIGNSVIQHSQWNTTATGWGCAGRNVNLLFDNGAESTNRAMFVYNNGSYADLRCGNVYAPNVTTPSGRAFKEKITTIPYEPLTVIRRSPAKQWQYRQGALTGNPPDDDGPWMLRRRKQGTDRLTGHHDDFEMVEHERPTTPHQLSYVGVRRVGPMADDIAEHAPHMVHEDSTGQLHLSMGDQIGVLWAAVERLANKVDELCDKHADIKELPGRRPASA